MMTLLDSVAFGTDGLVPAIVQDGESGEILMLAYMNREALQKTLETGKSHFWSRSRNALWRKGETSGNEQTMRQIRLDCDGDALLLKVDQKGVACHTGERSCFYRQVDGNEITKVATGQPLWQECKTAILQRVHDVIMDRKRNPQEDSYTCKLFAAGKEVILKKIGEESSEVIIASMAAERSQVIYEVADLFYHVLVLLGHHDIPLTAIFDELQKRQKAGPALPSDF